LSRGLADLEDTHSKEGRSMVHEPSMPYVADVAPRELVDHVHEPQMKWRVLTVVERVLTFICGVILAAFTSAVLVDVVSRSLGIPVSWLQNFILGSFVWGIFLGAAVAQRRREHFRLAAIAEHFGGIRRQLFESLEDVVVLLVAFWMTYFGYVNVLSGQHNYLQPTEVPLSYVTASIPVSGLLIMVFSVERLFHVWSRGDLLAHPGPTGQGPAGVSGSE
jgi:TRAP-type transport system small permease protein